MIPTMAETATLRGISEIRAFFRTNQTPIYFVSPTAFNLLGIDRWVRNFFYVNYFDSFEGTHPRVFVPRSGRTASSSRWRTSATTCSRTPRGPERVARRGPGGKARVRDVRRGDRGGGRRRPASRSRCPRPSCATASTRRSSPRSSPTRRACRARRTRSATRRSYAELLALADEAGLGDDLVVQTPYGDSGKTTFFIAGRGDWDEERRRRSRPRSSRS